MKNSNGTLLMNETVVPHVSQSYWLITGQSQNVNGISALQSSFPHTTVASIVFFESAGPNPGVMYRLTAFRTRYNLHDTKSSVLITISILNTDTDTSINTDDTDIQYWY